MGTNKSHVQHGECWSRHHITKQHAHSRNLILLLADEDVFFFDERVVVAVVADLVDLVVLFGRNIGRINDFLMMRVGALFPFG